MLIDLANVLGRRIANSIDLIDKREAVKAVTGALHAARELSGANKAEVYHVVPTPEQNIQENVFYRFACSPSYSDDIQKPTYGRRALYSVKRQVGVWNYVYDTKNAIWVIGPNQDLAKVPLKNSASAQTAYCEPLHNCIPDTPTPEIPAMYNFADKRSGTVITFPFTKKIEEGETCWGILDFEFEKEVEYAPDLHKSLKLLTKHISNIVWKQRFWERTKKDTADVVNEFYGWCMAQGSASVSYKTGLLIKDHGFSCKLYDNLKNWFARNFVQMDEYDLEAKSTNLELSRNLDIRQVIEKEHFGIVDVTRHDQRSDLLFLLGLFAMSRRPCLVLASSIASREEIPDIVRSVARELIKIDDKPDEIDDKPDELGESLFHVYKYHIVGGDIVFVRERDDVDEKRERDDVDEKDPLQTFLQSVRRQSKEFRNARDYQK